MKEPILEVNNLSVSFYNRKGKKDETHIQAVRGISYSLEKGESFGIVGEIQRLRRHRRRQRSTIRR